MVLLAAEASVDFTPWYLDGKDGASLKETTLNESINISLALFLPDMIDYNRLR